MANETSLREPFILLLMVQSTKLRMALNLIPTIYPESEGRNAFSSTKFDTITEVTNGKSLQT